MESGSKAGSLAGAAFEDQRHFVWSCRVGRDGRVGHSAILKRQICGWEVWPTGTTLGAVSKCFAETWWSILSNEVLLACVNWYGASQRRDVATKQVEHAQWMLSEC